ncbi:MAG: hypothetical protein ACUVQH_05175 [Thermogutta sp.]
MFGGDHEIGIAHQHNVNVRQFQGRLQERLVQDAGSQLKLLVRPRHSGIEQAPTQTDDGSQLLQVSFLVLLAKLAKQLVEGAWIGSRNVLYVESDASVAPLGVKQHLEEHCIGLD